MVFGMGSSKGGAVISGDYAREKSVIDALDVTASPLAGKGGGWRRAHERAATPLPVPPPQGGRERWSRKRQCQPLLSLAPKSLYLVTPQ